MLTYLFILITLNNKSCFLNVRGKPAEIGKKSVISEANLVKSPHTIENNHQSSTEARFWVMTRPQSSKFEGFWWIQRLILSLCFFFQRSEVFSECSRIEKVKSEKKAICRKLFHFALLCLPRKFSEFQFAVKSFQRVDESLGSPLEVSRESFASHENYENLRKLHRRNKIHLPWTKFCQLLSMSRRFLGFPPGFTPGCLTRK